MVKRLCFSRKNDCFSSAIFFLTPKNSHFSQKTAQNTEKIQLSDFFHTLIALPIKQENVLLNLVNSMIRVEMLLLALANSEKQ